MIHPSVSPKTSVRRLHTVSALAISAMSLTIGGCATYSTPGGPADMRVFGGDAAIRRGLTDPGIQAALNKQPLAIFPAAMAISQVQAPGYLSWSGSSYGGGVYSVVTTRRPTDDARLDRITKLPMLTGVAPISRILLPTTLTSDKELRQAAASLHADLLLIYTFDTAFRTEDFASPLTLVSLGLFPTKNARVTTTASAVLLDTRNGYVYGSAESSSKPQTQLANAWTSKDAVDDARLRAEAEALDGLVDEFEKLWGKVLTMQVQYQLTPRTVTLEQRNAAQQDSAGSSVPQGPTYRTPAK